MTLRALFVGFVAALFIAGAGYINDRILSLESFNSGHLVPVIVFGFLFLTILTLNPLLYRLRRSWAFSTRELVMIVVLTTAACSIPGRGLMEQFPTNIIMPHHWNLVNPGWREQELMSYVPDGAFVERTEENHDEVVTSFVTGADPSLARRTEQAWLLRTVKQVPWSAWMPALYTWMPLIFLGGLVMCCLAIMVHRQWSSYEHLSYPIAQFAGSLVERRKGSAFPDVFRNRIFWLGLGIVLAIRLNNGLHRWFPEVLIPVNLRWSMHPLGQLWPALYRSSWGVMLLRFNVFPLVIGFAFFLSTEVSLTLGLSQFLYCLFALPLISYGVDLSTEYAIGGWEGYMRAGSYLAFALMMLYTGRAYYGELVVRMFGFRPKGESAVEARAVWAGRICLLAGLAQITLIVRLGLAWPWALATVLLMHLSFVIVSRISAETGLFMIHVRWQPFGILLGMLGAYAFGPTGIMVSALVCTNLCIDQSQALMPYLTNGLKLSERAGLDRGKVACWTYVLYAVGVVVAMAAVLVAVYEYGCTSYHWSRIRIPSVPFVATERAVMHLKAVGVLDVAETLPWYRRLNGIHPRGDFWWAAGCGFVFVLIFGALRLRVPKWPLHPVLFLLWATWAMGETSHSFFIGWMIKSMVTRFGGPRAVRKVKPLMIGVILGDISGALVFMIVGAVYFLVTGKPPTSYVYFPR